MLKNDLVWNFKGSCLYIKSDRITANRPHLKTIATWCFLSGVSVEMNLEPFLALGDQVKIDAKSFQGRVRRFASAKLSP